MSCLETLVSRSTPLVVNLPGNGEARVQAVLALSVVLVLRGRAAAAADFESHLPPRGK